ncbi:MAG: helix-turn-helix domain-containing protein [Okeania sp. SIO2G4]|uniref:helix-turn-helix domain-containing protein n=1 Tax=unclassified Okeania TaxID=2634635 RepID=UPI0013BC0D6B|nr:MULTISPECIES: helix-turn-helix domain-containing protein [unclassified Okeania]NEP45011.1 helix-turn-helix domain-containing protein [Okeania sp. SIO2H7]NEP70411.1 helix-turn-helix domain-containing protein [Okeania sp. SIO2G5]NEP96163.1 helix-turn-helix domain-containing protein [Okeania sp. SIO2F5]NEQ93933.1 helix-turn-helix domain-containing protein [Okeania sp. SIO2G4]
MNQSFPINYASQLQNLMKKASISSFKELSQKAGVSELQLIRLRRGLGSQMRVDILLKISQALGITFTELLDNFAPELVKKSVPTSTSTLEKEYNNIQANLEQQKQFLTQEFQQSSLQILESWLQQWPTVVYKVKQNPRLPATKILPLLRPVEQLIQQWNVESIVPVGVEVPFDPQLHQLMEGSAQEGELVKVRYTGYRQGGKLLFRAKVSPIN